MSECAAGAYIIVGTMLQQVGVKLHELRFFKWLSVSAAAAELTPAACCLALCRLLELAPVKLRES